MLRKEFDIINLLLIVFMLLSSTSVVQSDNVDIKCDSGVHLANQSLGCTVTTASTCSHLVLIIDYGDSYSDSVLVTGGIIFDCIDWV